MSQIRRTFLDGSAEFVLVGSKLRLRIYGSTANGGAHEVLVDYSDCGDFPIALLIRSARAAIRRRRQRDDAARNHADAIALQTADLRELPR